MTRNSLSLIVCLALTLGGCSGQAPTETRQAPARKTPETRAETAAKPADDALVLPPNPGLLGRHEVREFIRGMVQKHGFSETELNRAFEAAGTVPKILDAMAKPFEAKPWYSYRKLFLTEKRIAGGEKFLKENQAALSKAKSRYGVAPEMVTAIIGIESAFGAKPGNYRIIDALSTLAFDYPRRKDFFQGELEQFLLLCREEGMDYLAPRGSYAGAMGMPQFMPSSYRKLAADGDGDGRRDIWNNPADAIASVAHYFAKNGWHSGEPLAIPAKIKGEGALKIVSTKTPKAAYSKKDLEAQGVLMEGRMPDNLKAGLLKLEGAEGPEYWVTFHNFNVIMRYNHSALYAMAATSLVGLWTDR